MKSILLFLCSIVFLQAIKSQTIKENQVDDFTKNKVIRTTWEPLSKNGNVYAHARASKINDQCYIELKLMLAGGGKGGDIFSIKDGADIMLKLNNDSVITLKNTKYEIACKGCGAINIIGSDAYGVSISLPVTSNQIEDLISCKVVKIRVYTMDGYVEGDVKDKFGETISKELKLIKSI